MTKFYLFISNTSMESKWKQSYFLLLGRLLWENISVMFFESLEYLRASIKYLSPSVVISRIFSHIFTHYCFPFQALQQLHNPLSFSTLMSKPCHSTPTLVLIFMCFHLIFHFSLQTPFCTPYHKPIIPIIILFPLHHKRSMALTRSADLEAQTFRHGNWCWCHFIWRDKGLTWNSRVTGVTDRKRRDLDGTSNIQRPYHDGLCWIMYESSWWDTISIYKGLKQRKQWPIVNVYRWHLSRIVTGLSRILEVLLTAFGKIERDHVLKTTIATSCDTNNTNMF